jgi:hypothetical protein
VINWLSRPRVSRWVKGVLRISRVGLSLRFKVPAWWWVGSCPRRITRSPQLQLTDSRGVEPPAQLVGEGRPGEGYRCPDCFDRSQTGHIGNLRRRDVGLARHRPRTSTRACDLRRAQQDRNGRLGGLPDPASVRSTAMAYRALRRRHAAHPRSPFVRTSPAPPIASATHAFPRSHGAVIAPVR